MCFGFTNDIPKSVKELDLMTKGFVRRGLVKFSGGLRGKLLKTREWGQHDSMMFTKKQTSANVKSRMSPSPCRDRGPSRVRP